MKNLLLILLIAIFVSCDKKQEDPAMTVDLNVETELRTIALENESRRIKGQIELNEITIQRLEQRLAMRAMAAPSYPGEITVYPDRIVVTATTGTTRVTDVSQYPGMEVSTSTLKDWANIQYAIKLEESSIDKEVVLVGTFRGVDNNVIIDKYNARLTLRGYAKIYPTATVVGGVFRSEVPKDLTDANKMVNRVFTIKDIDISCSSRSQMGWDLGPSNYSTFENLKVSQARNGLPLRFSMHALVQHCSMADCDTSYMLANGNFPGANNANSGSNVSTIKLCEAYSNGSFTASVGIGIYASGGTYIEQSTIEGGKCKKGIDFDGLGANVVRDVTIRKVHFENVKGYGDGSTDECAIYLRMAGGIASIDNIKSHYPGIIINAGSSAGYPRVVLSNCTWWPSQPNGKFFVNRATNSIAFSWILNRMDWTLGTPSANYFVNRGVTTTVDAATTGWPGANKARWTW